MKELIYCWTQGGMGHNMTLLEAGIYLTQQRHRSEFQWEVRHPGSNIDDSQFFATLDAAVSSAVPYWEDIGLTWEQAALVAMTSDLVLSTGIEVGEDEQ